MNKPNYPAFKRGDVVECVSIEKRWLAHEDGAISWTEENGCKVGGKYIVDDYIVNGQYPLGHSVHLKGFTFYMSILNFKKTK